MIVRKTNKKKMSEPKTLQIQKTQKDVLSQIIYKETYKTENNKR